MRGRAEGPRVGAGGAHGGVRAGGGTNEARKRRIRVHGYNTCSLYDVLCSHHHASKSVSWCWRDAYFNGNGNYCSCLSHETPWRRFTKKHTHTKFEDRTIHFEEDRHHLLPNNEIVPPSGTRLYLSLEDTLASPRLKMIDCSRASRVHPHSRRT